MIFHLIKAGSQTGYKFSLLDYILCTIFCYLDINNKCFSKNDVINGCKAAALNQRIATYSVIREAATTVAKKRILENMVKCPKCGTFQAMKMFDVIHGSIPATCACGLTGLNIVDGIFKKDKMLSTLWDNPLVSEGHKQPSVRFKEDCGYDLRGI